MKLIRKAEQPQEDVRIKFGDTIMIEGAPLERYYLVGHTYNSSDDLIILLNLETGRQWTATCKITQKEYSAMLPQGKGLSLSRIATITGTDLYTMHKVELEVKETC